jgi:predicted RNA-binding protein (virulence factor B family)
MLEICKTVTLEVLRTVPMGLILGDEEDEVLLPTRYVPKDVSPGDTVEVFLYTDSEDRPIATTDKPFAQADEFACLRVVSVTKTGAFLDWGLPKDLLLPFASQVHTVRAEERVVVRVLLDAVSQRPIATAKFQRYVKLPPEDLREGQGVEWMVFEETDLGSKAIVNGEFEGLFYGAIGEPGLKRGACGSGYVQRIRKDGKVDLSLTPSGLAGIDNARDVLLKALRQAGGKLQLGDRSDPDDIRATLGLSKKAFKRAAGLLYRERKVRVEDLSIELIDD